MSKIVYICYREHSSDRHTRDDIEKLSRRILPDNITLKPPLVIRDTGILIGILNPMDVLPIKYTSVCMGNMIKPKEDWWQPGTDLPDGSYALYRGNEANIELVTDIVASRTIWYIKTDNMFIASSSQRAIVSMLGSFEPNESVYPWMLSTGNLGPGLSWDKRIQQMPPNTRLTLDRNRWEFTITKIPVVIDPVDRTYEEHERNLQEILTETFAHIDLDPAIWVLPLSGGMDSRAILVMLKNRQDYKAITWGTKSAVNDKYSDAYVASKLTQHYGLEHKYYEVDQANERVETIIDRFITAGEGRIDHIAGYTDGMNLWKNMYEDSIQGIIRGDQGFGRDNVNSVLDVKRIMNLTTVADYSNINMFQELEDMEQEIPDTLKQKKDETLQTYRDRLIYEHKLPHVMSSLNELKCCYVEISNPLLSRAIINEVIMLPDDLRTDKLLFRNLINKLGPDIESSRSRAIKTNVDILRSQGFTRYLINELDTAYAKQLFDNKLITNVIKKLNFNHAITVDSRLGKTIKRAIKSVLPAKVNNVLIHRTTPLLLDINILAFRMIIISIMNRILIVDAKSFINK